MVGCGAPRRNVSRLSPSILQIFPAESRRRYGSSSPSPYYNTLLCKPCLDFMLQTCTFGGINSFHYKSESLSPGSSCYVSIDTKNLLIITDLVDCAYRSPKMESLLCAAFLSTSSPTTLPILSSSSEHLLFPFTAPALFVVQVISLKEWNPFRYQISRTAGM